MPASKYGGEMKKEKLVKAISKMIPNFATDLTAETADNFLVSEPSKPKVLLFSNKDKVPTILKALSSDSVFKRSIKFGFVKHTEESVVKKMKVKKFPAFVMVRGSKSEIREEYKGDMNFRLASGLAVSCTRLACGSARRAPGSKFTYAPT